LTVTRSFSPPLIGLAHQPCYGPKAMTQPSPSSLRTEALGYADALFRLAYHLTGSDADAEDLVQDTYARALGATTRFVEGTNLKAWLFRILRNAYIDDYRRARANPVDAGFDDDDPRLQAPQELLRDDQELERLRSVVAEDIEAALATLSPDARTIVLLDLEGLTESELAGVLGCAPGTVKSRLTRARVALRQKLRDYARP
jgi:RNA polymerase sigma-70 factor (ECF subfamily)